MWINIADDLTPEGKKNLKTGKVLGFQQPDGEMHHYIVRKINRKSDLYYIERMNHLYTEEEMLEVVKKEQEAFTKQLEAEEARRGRG